MSGQGILKKIKLLKRCLDHGCLAHASTVETRVLKPFQADDCRFLPGNLVAIYATDKLSFLTSNRFFAGKELFSWVNVYLCDPGRFTRISAYEFVSLFDVAPVHVIRFTREDVFHILKKTGKGRVNGSVLAGAQGDELYRRYNENVSGFLASSRLHGWDHVRSVASLGYILAGQECPGNMNEVLVGAFFHDIGRIDDAGGRLHAERGAVRAARIIKSHWPGLDAARVIYAIKHHADGKVTGDKVIGCIWDADRLCLTRVCRKIDQRLLSTPAAKKAAVTLNNIVDDQWRRHSGEPGRPGARVAPRIF